MERKASGFEGISSDLFVLFIEHLNFVGKRTIQIVQFCCLFSFAAAAVATALRLNDKISEHSRRGALNLKREIRLVFARIHGIEISNGCVALVGVSRCVGMCVRALGRFFGNCSSSRTVLLHGQVATVQFGNNSEVLQIGHICEKMKASNVVRGFSHLSN